MPPCDRLLGTPSEDVWPGVSKLRDWHEFPQWKAQDLASLVPELNEQGIDLLSKMLQYDPAKRIHATEALQHPYFADLDKQQFVLMQELNKGASRAARPAFARLTRLAQRMGTRQTKEALGDRRQGTLDHQRSRPHAACIGQPASPSTRV